MLQWLLDQQFMPHGHCYYWRPDILWTQVGANAVIAIAYYSIPVTLLYFVLKRRDVPLRWILGLFAAFIVLCGTTHVMDIVTIWRPLYALDGIVKMATAAVSIVTAAVLIPLVPTVLGMRMPAELEAANRQLRQEVQRRAAAEQRLARANELLRTSNEELEQFAYVASHDLQTPIRGIVNFSQLLRREDGTRLSERGREFLGFIEDSGTQMHRLVKALLEVSRVGRQFTTVPVDLAEALAQACRNLHLDIAARGAKIEAGPLPRVSGDPVLLTQLLQNLIGNAIKYVARGTAPRIRLEAQREAEGWHLMLSDNGIGIAEEHLKSVFVLFRRLHGPEEYPGVGIGLALCKKICDLHGGRIWAESRPGVGSRFHFLLPAVPESAADAADADTTTRRRRNRPAGRDPRPSPAVS